MCFFCVFIGRKESDYNDKLLVEPGQLIRFTTTPRAVGNEP